MANAEVKLTFLKKALASLKAALTSPLLEDPAAHEFMRDSVVKRFEYTYELCRNTLRKILADNFEEEPATVKDVYRIAGRYGLIDNVERWFYYHDARNNTSHRYIEEAAEEAFAAAKPFVVDAANLLVKLEEALNDSAN
jgi:nucleotidyltransferase substrate binding protein (TIGR01987 family)